MKKLILTSLVAFGAMYNSMAFGPYSQSVVIQPNTYTNLLYNISPTNGQFVVNQVIITAGTTNASVIFVDAPNRALTYVVGAYTNMLSYGTNYINSWTNYYNVVCYTTNITQIDVTNSVASATVSYPTPIAGSALAGTSTVINNGNYNFNNGIWVTNSSVNPGIATVTINYNTAPFPSR